MEKNRLETFDEYKKRIKNNKENKVIKKREKIITSVSLAIYAMALLCYVAFSSPQPDKVMYNDYISMEDMEKIIELINEDPAFNNLDFPIEKLIATLYERGLLYGPEMDKVALEAIKIAEERKETDKKTR